MDKQIRVLIAKPGLDGHDRGALVISQGLRDAGMEVIYSGLRQTPEQIVSTAIQEDVDCIGLSILSGAHNELFPVIVQLLKENQAEDILVIGGGVIPDEDIPFLNENGIKKVFTPGSPITDIANFIKSHYEQKAEQKEIISSVKKIDHIGIAVKSLDDAIPFYRDILGLRLIGLEEVLEEGVRVAFFEVGETKLELLEANNADSAIQKHIDKRGEGIHHIAFEVDGIKQQLDVLDSRQVPLLQNEPKKGAHGKQVGFIHPKAASKVLIEFCESTKGE